MSEKTLKLIKDNDIKWVDLRFTDTRGKWQHVTFPAKVVDESFMDGVMFDGSSVAGWIPAASGPSRSKRKRFSAACAAVIRP